jgi:hypothetical protein
MDTAEEVGMMRKVRIRSMADLEALPEGEWVKTVDGLRWNVPVPTTIEATDTRVDVAVPEDARAGFPFREGERLEATLKAGVLRIRRPSARKAKRKPSR